MSHQDIELYSGRVCVCVCCAVDVLMYVCVTQAKGRPWLIEALVKMF